jgi:hypothetical protein
MGEIGKLGIFRRCGLLVLHELFAESRSDAREN